MTRRVAFALLAPVLLFTLGAKAAKKEKKEPGPAARVVSMNGFQIAALEFGETDVAVVQPLSMLLPATNGFAANVSVQIQKYAGTIDEFEALSRTQFEQLGATIVSYEKTAPNVLRGEYKAQLQGHSLHFYVRSIHTADKVYLATATATETQWQQLGVKLKANVDSFQVP